MDTPSTAKTLTIIAYGALLVGVISFLALTSLPWAIFIAWPLILIGFIAWAILLTVADKYRGSDKKAAYKRNQIIFLILFGLIILITLFSTVLR